MVKTGWPRRQMLGWLYPVLILCACDGPQGVSAPYLEHKNDSGGDGSMGDSAVADRFAFDTAGRDLHQADASHADTAASDDTAVASDSGLADTAGVDGGDVDSGGCTNGTQRCGNQCVDTQTHLEHCGHCERGCTGSNICLGGDCLPSPDCTLNPCPSGYYCEAGSGLCHFGCTSSVNCPENSACNTVTHRCECSYLYHMCGDTCLSIFSPEACADSCTPCPAPTNGSATCNGFSCGVSCNSGFHLCGDQCVSNNSTDHCGASCSPCPLEPNGQATCDGVSCGVTCQADHHPCNNRCVANSDVDHCGSSCTPCATSTHGTAVCDGTQCSLSCDLDYHQCGNSCVYDDDTDHCGTLCTPCPTSTNGTASCDGTSCGISCHEGYHLCGEQCVDNTSDQHCGELCTPCQRPQYGSVSCENQICVASCLSGYHYSAGQCHNWGVTLVENHQLALSSMEIAADSQNQPHIAYTRRTSGNISSIFHASKVDGNWSIETVEECDTQTGVSLAIDANDDIHMSYTAKCAGQWSVRYIRQLSGVWATETIEHHQDTWVVADTAIALDLNNQPHVVYRHHQDPNLVTKYAYRSANGWVTETIEDMGSPFGYLDESTNSIALDSQNLPHVIYYHDYYNTFQYAKKTGLGWVIETVDSDYSTGRFNDLVLDGNDIPYATYSKWVSNTGMIHRFAEKSSGTWSTSAIEADEIGPGHHTSLSMDSSGMLHVCYADANPGADSDTAKCAYLSGDVWRVSTVHRNYDHRGYLSSTLDGDDRLHVAFGHLGADNRPLRYATW